MAKSRIEANDMKFHLPSSLGSNAHTPTLYPDDYVSWVIHMEDYITGLEKGDEIWKSIMKGPYRDEKTKQQINTKAEMLQYIEDHDKLPSEILDKLKWDQKAIRELRFGLNPSALQLIGGCMNAHEIWMKLKETYTAENNVIQSNRL